ncbi:lanthionine synthetase LanC family protein [Streptomyces sp. DSM 41972]|uniref:non-specific serine/threonine protein kinase n=1 Tax=Streptomyces althioticus subsp. attaecolombicae TaxID=3075534 RepID=A0ABU3I3W4_9ACTN|nr:lanthionine synthetase LanC family protein [Streptomyces sp. DSM 41972]SCE11597.1 Protein kinase domain-containing protein [Streptomyces sp. di50b]SCE46668.1 Protein kinase domain-containing protein [Streptomyces sp. di188]
MLPFPLKEIVRSVLAGLGQDAWSLTETGGWCYVEAPDGPQRVQGWKLHVSATALSAPHVLHRAAEVLVAAGCTFKFARSVEVIEEMTSSRYDRAQCGKVITAYPRDDERFRSLAAALDTATAGLPGPAILSDRPYRKGGLVHYRYGAFRGRNTLTSEGSYETRLEAPDGSLVTDHRKPWFSPPPWAELPFEGEPGRTAKPAVPEAVLLDGRFEVRGAIRHSARGGVYRALDRKTGEDVVVKQARAHVGGGLTGEDARSLLRREGRMLTLLDGICPELVHEFEQDGHAFLVERLVPGTPLTQWVQERITEAGDDTGVDPAEAVAMSRALVRLLEDVHDRGLVYQDFTPGNVMVTDEGRPVLIDPEWAVAPGTWMPRAMTPGFTAPERVLAPSYGPAHGPEADLYALGAVLCYLVTGLAPSFAQDEPREAAQDEPQDEPREAAQDEPQDEPREAAQDEPQDEPREAAQDEPQDESREAAQGEPRDAPRPRTHPERIRELLAAVGGQRPAARLLAPAVAGLTHEDPERRWSARRVREFLSATAIPDTAGEHADAAGNTTRLPAGPDRDTWRRMTDDGLTRLLRDMADPATEPRRLWSADAFGEQTDACALQHGAAGPLAVLVRADRLLGRDDLRAGIERAAGWIDARRTSVPRLLPGLQFGRSGTAWALHDAAVRLDDAQLAGRAAELALSVPVRWPNPDVCHGAAGAGLAQLHFWHATGRAEFLERAEDCADGLASAAQRTAGTVFWPVPEDFDSALAGIRHLGFAHGVAGIGTFLLYAGLATDRGDLLDLAVEAGDTLVAEAERGPWGARWRSDLTDPPGTGLQYHWCSGSSGVGTFLLRLWRATGAEPYLRLSREAAAAVHRVRWFSPSAACHGIAGNGDFLLDLAACAPDGPYRDWAEDLAAVLYARHAVRDGLLLVPDGSGQSFHADYQTGLSGPLDFLLRLGHGGPRSWLPDAAVATRLQEAAGADGPAAPTTPPHRRRSA